MATTAAIALAALLAAPGAGRPFAIEVLDAETGRGVPLIELRTVNEIRLVTDSNGIAAFDEPGLMGRPAFFHVKGHGYTYPADGFGFRGKALVPVPGGSARLQVDRVNVAERLYRVTGGGIYRDSLLTGRPAPTRRPVLDARVLGSDSVLTAVFGGKVHWFWGDTNRPDYPLGNFHTPWATSRLPADGGLDPSAGVDLDYAAGPDGFARPAAKLPGDGPTWLDGLVVLADSSGRERMFAAFGKIRPPLDVEGRGIAEFDVGSGTFRPAAAIPTSATIYPRGHPFVDARSGKSHVYYADSFPLVRVRADPAELVRPEAYEAFTCVKPGARAEVDRDDRGAVRYAWRRDAAPLDPALQARLIRDGRLSAGEGLYQLRDATTGRPVVPHKGSVNWNAYRRRWVMLVAESGGTTSALGETWYAEADAPLGPWVYASKVVTHDNYTFYNPRHHPFFDAEGGRLIYFEGTYTRTFAADPEPTPRYDYNQIMYRLDLSDPRLNLPVAVYRLPDGTLGPAGLLGRAVDRPEVAFFAPDRPGPGTVPVSASRDGAGRWRLSTGPLPGVEPLFHAWPLDARDPPKDAATLRESDGDAPAYRVDPAQGRPICLVRRNPMSWAVPRD